MSIQPEDRNEWETSHECQWMREDEEESSDGQERKGKGKGDAPISAVDTGSL